MQVASQALHSLDRVAGDGGYTGFFLAYEGPNSEGKVTSSPAELELSHGMGHGLRRFLGHKQNQADFLVTTHWLISA